MEQINPSFHSYLRSFICNDLKWNFLTSKNNWEFKILSIN